MSRVAPNGFGILSSQNTPFSFLSLIKKGVRRMTYFGITTFDSLSFFYIPIIGVTIIYDLHVFSINRIYEEM